MPHIAAATTPAHKKPHPVQVGFFGAQAIVQVPNALAHLIQQTSRLQGRAAGFYGIFITVYKHSPLLAMQGSKPTSWESDGQNIEHAPVYGAGFALYIRLGVIFSHSPLFNQKSERKVNDTSSCAFQSLGQTPRACSAGVGNFGWCRNEQANPNIHGIIQTNVSAQCSRSTGQSTGSHCLLLQRDEASCLNLDCCWQDQRNTRRRHPSRLGRPKRRKGACIRRRLVRHTLPSTRRTTRSIQSCNACKQSG